MTVLNYIREQKRKLEEKHMGETFLCIAGEEPIGMGEATGDCAQTGGTRSAWDILREIDAMHGLNVYERERASSRAYA